MPPKDFKPPADWRNLFDRVTKYRKVLPAPVDTIGCHCLKDCNAPEETQRFHTLVALMLSSQTKDEVTAGAMYTLIKRGLTPETVAAMESSELDKCIAKVGFHNMKTKYIKSASDIILREHNGHVPRVYEDLIALPGVGPKMAHLFFQSADSVVLGIGVDTHVHRISQRFGWVPTTVKGPEDTRRVLESWLPKEHWSRVNVLLVGLGQTICMPLRPSCSECALNDICPNAFKEKFSKGLNAAPKKVNSLRDIEDCVSGRLSPLKKKGRR